MDRILAQEQEESERIRVQLEKEEEEKRRLESGEPLEELRKDEAKVVKPEPAADRIGLRPAGRENIDEWFKAVLMQQWVRLS